MTLGRFAMLFVIGFGPQQFPCLVGSRVWGSSFRVQGLGLRFKVAGFRVVSEV